MVNQKEMVSKANSSVKSLLRAANILHQTSYDLHFEESLSHVIYDLSLKVEKVAEEVQRCKIAYASMSEGK